MLTAETLAICARMYIAITETKIIKDGKSHCITGDGADGFLQCVLMETVFLHAFQFLILLS